MRDLDGHDLAVGKKSDYFRVILWFRLRENYPHKYTGFFGRCSGQQKLATTVRESTVGHLTAVMLENLFIDVAFISASSWNLRGLSTPNENKAIVKQAVARVSEKCILLSDSSKYGKMANFRVMPLTELDLIISDEGLSDSVEQLTSQKIAVELAPPV